MDIACRNSSELWPKRISPNSLRTPEPHEQPSTVGMVLTAETGGRLATLLLKLIEWMVRPQIDLTCEEGEVRTTFEPPANTAITPTGNQVPSDILVLIAENTIYSMCVCPTTFLDVLVALLQHAFPSGEAVGQGPRRTAFQEAIKSIVDVGGYWREMGDTMVPTSSPVTDHKHWRTMGALLALGLLTGESLHPISPVVVYALLSNTNARPDAVTSMNLSLSLIQQLDSSKAHTLLPWMIIPPGQSLRNLPDGHRSLLLQVITGLDLDVSGTMLTVHFQGSKPSLSSQRCRLSQWNTTPSGPLSLSPPQ